MIVGDLVTLNPEKFLKSNIFAIVLDVRKTARMMPEEIYVFFVNETPFFNSFGWHRSENFKKVEYNNESCKSSETL